MRRVEKLVIGIIVVSLLLLCCIAVDYADEPIVATDNQSLNNTTNATILNGTFHSEKAIGTVECHGIVTEKLKVPTITITARPSCGCRNSYKWHTRTFVNYCPYCHRYGVLTNLYKHPARHEQEISCSKCSADFCGVCGKEKYSWSRKYLRRA